MGNEPTKQISSAEHFLREILPQNWNLRQRAMYRKDFDKHVQILKTKIEKSRSEQTQINAKFSKLQNDYAVLERKLAENAEEKSGMTNKIKQLEENVKKQEEELTKFRLMLQENVILKQRLLVTDHEKSDLVKKINQLEESIKQKQTNLQRDRERIFHLQTAIRQKNQVIEYQAKRINDNYLNNCKLEAINKDLKKGQDQKQRIIEQRQAFIQHLLIEHRQNHQQLLNQRQKYEQVQEHLRRALSSNLEQNRNNQDKDKQIQRLTTLRQEESEFTEYLKRKLRESDMRGELASQQNSQLQSECQHLKLANRQLVQNEASQLRYFNKQIAFLYQQKKIKEDQNVQLREMIRILRIKNLFQHSIMPQLSQQKLFLIQQIERVMHYRIKSTKIIFTCSADKMRVFDEDITFEQQKNYVLIMKIADNRFTAAFSGLTYYNFETNVANLLINLSTHRNFEILNERNPAFFTFQRPFIYFGNNDIRIKDACLKAHSKLGQKCSLFEASYDSPDYLFDGPQPAILESYELIELFFDE